jgi:hypothetical protein
VRSAAVSRSATTSLTSAEESRYAWARLPLVTTGNRYRLRARSSSRAALPGDPDPRSRGSIANRSPSAAVTVSETVDWGTIGARPEDSLGWRRMTALDRECDQVLASSGEVSEGRGPDAGVTQLGGALSATGYGALAMRNVDRVVVVIAIVLGFASGASAATSGWSRLPLPAGHSVIPYQVSCASQNVCFALGETGSDQFERYTATNTTRLQGPRGVRTSTVSALSCAAAFACVAVGTTTQVANHGLLALSWIRGRWLARSLPPGLGRSLKQGHYELTGLSCPSTVMCIAVGQVEGFTTRSHGATKPLLVRWDGRHWSSVPSPLTAGTLRSVSCASASSCTAVGAGNKGSVVLRLHAGHWTQVRLSAGDSRGVGSSLASISCPTATSCLATGLINTAPHAAVPVTRVVALRETGGRWSTEVPPVPALASGDHRHNLIDDLTAVSCGAPGSCLGVGMSVKNGGNGAEAGLSLAFTPTSPRPIAQTRATVPLSVSCPTTAFCLVGGAGSVRRYTPSSSAGLGRR